MRIINNRSFVILCLSLLIANPVLSNSKKKSSKRSSQMRELETVASSRSISHLLKSNVLIEVKEATGSGFFISKNLIVTNYHVIKNSHQQGDMISFRKQDGKRGWAVVGLIDSNNDLAILRTFTQSGIPLKLGDSSKVELTDDVIIVGSPQGLQGTVSKGIVSAKRKDFAGFEEIMQTSAPISQGSSGSPVLLAKTHKVIGVAVMVYREGQNLNFFIPINKLKGLIRANRDKMNDLVKHLGKQFWERAKSGDKKAQGLLGWSFYLGINWNKDYKRAVYWFKKNGSPIYYEDLATIYLNGGYGVQQDYVKAQKYILQAPDSAYKSGVLGMMYRDGIGFDKDYAEAFSHFLISFRQGNTFAYQLIGQLFFEQQKYLKSAFWFYFALIQNKDKNIETLFKASLARLSQSEFVELKHAIESPQDKYFMWDEPSNILGDYKSKDSEFGKPLSKDSTISKDETDSFFNAVSSGNLNLVKQYLRQGVDVNQKYKEGWTALMIASVANYLEMAKTLISAGADMNLQDKDGLTALIWASFKGHLEIAKTLISVGADMNLKDKDGRTALMWVSLRGHSEIVKVLVRAGAKVSAKDLTITEDEKIKKILKKALTIQNKKASKTP